MKIIFFISKKDNVLSMTANLPYRPTMNTDNDFYRTIFPGLFESDGMLIVRYMLEDKQGLTL